MSADSSAPAVQIQINPPRLFGGAAILWVVAYGLLLALPVFVLTVVVVSQPKYGPVTYLIPLLALAFATVFLPFGFGNPHVSRLVGAPPRPTGHARLHRRARHYAGCRRGDAGIMISTRSTDLRAFAVRIFVRCGATRPPSDVFAE